MDDVDLKIASMEKELTKLQTRISALGERLAKGEGAVRAELNPLIRRERELSSELHDLKVSSGRLTLDLSQVMYGPPSSFSTRNAQQGETGHTRGNTPKLSEIWRRIFGRR